MKEIIPGIHHNIDLFRRSKGLQLGRSERHVIWQLKQMWFVTFVNISEFKGSTYSYVLLKPTKKITETFRIEREVLVLIQRYDNFEGRTLDYVDKLMFEYQNRLDKLAFILVSQDSEIKSKIKQLTLQEPESRIIIPYTYDDFFDDDAQEILWNTLKANFYGRDLFSFESPLQNETYFFGRDESVPFFYDKYKTGENSGLFGLRKIGKTSVLYALLRNLEFRNELGIFIDCQDPSLHKRRWFQALEYIIKKINSKIRNKNDIIIDLNKNYEEITASELFEDDLKKIFKANNDSRILLIFDEIENITFNLSPTEHWKSGGDYISFWQTIRSVFQNNPNIFSFIIAGVNPMIIETGTINTFDNPIYRIITPKYLKFFKAKDVREMVTTIGTYMGLEFDEEIITYLTEDYGGHPFLIRQICSKIHNELTNQRPFKVTKYYYQQHKSDYDKSLIDYIELIIQVLSDRYKEEYELLELLAIEDISEFNKLVNSSEKLINHLLGYNLIEKSDSEYFIRIKAVKTYLELNSQFIKSIYSKEEKWKTITELRGNVELNIKRLLLLSIKLLFGRIKGKQNFLSIIKSGSKRYEKLESLNLEEIFSDEGELYFNDYKSFILKYWTDYQTTFSDKQLFETYMSIVNANRIDAHAKSIDHSLFQALIFALKWLDKKLKNILEE
jgi:GTPase SAR1 family protein